VPVVRGDRLTIGSCHRLTLATAFLLLLLNLQAPTAGSGCFSIVVGKDASADGCVLMGHNEDDSPPLVVQHHKVPRLSWASGSKQVAETWAYIWSEIPGLLYSDSYLNEWGVCIASDNCPSREDRPELAGAGIRKMLRRLVAQRARSAREGVLLAGRLVERFGYGASGRTYIICDPREGWLFCAIHGKRWLAARVPDDRVAMVANTLTIGEIDLTDPDRFLGSADIIDYAILRGWFDPAQNVPFDFAAAYANPRSAEHPSNAGRLRAGLCQVSAEPIPQHERLPFAVVPGRKLSIGDLMGILRVHEEEDERALEAEPHGGDPHASGFPICNRGTQTSFVAQLRGDRPLEVGLVYWVCLAPPCLSCYMPFNFGISAFPEGFAEMDAEPSAELFRARTAGPFRADPASAYWTFANLHDKAAGTGSRLIREVRGLLRPIEARALARQATREAPALKLYRSDPAAAGELLDRQSAEGYRAVMAALGKLSIARQ
jgi:dipeptidase